MVGQRIAVALTAAVAAVALGGGGAAVGQDSTAPAVSVVPDNGLSSRVGSLEAQIRELTGGAPISPIVGTRQGGIYATYENVIVKPFFSRDDAAGDDGEGGTAKSYGFSWEMKYSPRIEVGYLSEPGGIGFRARYWNFDQSTHRKVSGSDLHVEMQADPTIQISGTSLIAAQHALRVSTFDLEAMTRFRNVLVSGGLRVAEVQQHFQAFDLANGGDAVRSNQDFTGCGPTIAAELRQPIGSLPVNLFASVRGSAVYGNRNMRLTDLGSGNQYIRGVNDLMPIGEIQLGVESFLELYEDHFFFIKVAAEAQTWIGAGTGYIDNITDSNDESRHADNANANMGFIGLVISAGFLW